MTVSLWLQILSIFAVLVLHCIFNFHHVWVYALGGILFGAVYWLVRKFSGGKFGMGDVLFGVFQGCCLELVALPVVLAVEAVIGAVVFAVVVLFKRGKGGRARATLPFLPVMGGALVVVKIFFESGFVHI